MPKKSADTSEEIPVVIDTAAVADAPTEAEKRLDPVTLKSFELAPQYDDFQSRINAAAKALADAILDARVAGVRVSAAFQLDHLAEGRIIVG